MTAKYQWKKYKIDYNYTYREEKSSFECGDFNIYSNDYKFNHHYYFSIDGYFTISGNMEAYLFSDGDLVYAYRLTDDSWQCEDGRREKTIYSFKIRNAGAIRNLWRDKNFRMYALVSEYAQPHLMYKAVVDTKTPKQGAYIGLVQGQEGAFPKDGEKDGYWYVYDKKLNTPPTKPTSLKVPDKVISKLGTEISWSESTDPEGDAISYKLERALDRGEFVEVYKGALTRFKDVIADKGHRLVVYRVTAIDSNGDSSESLESGEIPVIDNEIPVIETASTNLGKITTPYSVSYKIKDADSGQTWKVTESLDGKVLKTFDAKVGTSYTSKMTPSDWQKVLNGKHILKIEVVDSEQGKDVKEISFEKDVRKLDFELGKAGLQGIDKMPERAILSMGATIPSGASIKVEITNNGLDAKPVWQDCTTQVLGGDKIFFSNKTKTATKWAVNIRVIGDKKTATEVLSVSSIGGFYD